MPSPVKFENISWNNLPSEEVLQEMSSAELLDAIRALEAEKPLPPPEAAIDWFISSAPAPGPDRDKANKALLCLLGPLRYSYTKKLMDLADQAFKREPLGHQNETLFEDLTRRMARLHASMSLGLRTKDEIDWARDKQSELGGNTGIAIDKYSFQFSKNHPHTAERIAKELERWKGCLEEIEGGLSALDKVAVCARIDEELKKPFIPSRPDIENTRMQLSSYDNDVGEDYALSLLQKENQARMDILSEWRADLNSEAPPAPRRASP